MRVGRILSSTAASASDTQRTVRGENRVDKKGNSKALDTQEHHAKPTPTKLLKVTYNTLSQATHFHKATFIVMSQLSVNIS